MAMIRGTSARNVFRKRGERRSAYECVGNYVAGSSDLNDFISSTDCDIVTDIEVYIGPEGMTFSGIGWERR